MTMTIRTTQNGDNGKQQDFRLLDWEQVSHSAGGGGCRHTKRGAVTMRQALPRWLRGTATLLAPALWALCVGMAVGTETRTHRRLRSSQTSISSNEAAALPIITTTLSPSHYPLGQAPPPKQWRMAKTKEVQCMALRVEGKGNFCGHPELGVREFVCSAVSGQGVPDVSLSSGTWLGCQLPSQAPQCSPAQAPSLIHGTGSTPSTDVWKRRVDTEVTVGGFSSVLSENQSDGFLIARLSTSISYTRESTSVFPILPCFNVPLGFYPWPKSCLINGPALLNSKTLLNYESFSLITPSPRANAYKFPIAALFTASLTSLAVLHLYPFTATQQKGEQEQSPAITVRKNSSLWGKVDRTESRSSYMALTKTKKLMGGQKADPAHQEPLRGNRTGNSKQRDRQADNEVLAAPLWPCLLLVCRIIHTIKAKLKVLRCAALLAHAASVRIFSPPPDGLKIPRSHGSEGQRGGNVRGCLLPISEADSRRRVCIIDSNEELFPARDLALGLPAAVLGEQNLGQRKKKVRSAPVPISATVTFHSSLIKAGSVTGGQLYDAVSTQTCVAACAVTVNVPPSQRESWFQTEWCALPCLQVIVCVQKATERSKRSQTRTEGFKDSVALIVQSSTPTHSTQTHNTQLTEIL
ncbi:unnamed protein product [Leuciscus chuanchicus]